MAPCPTIEVLSGTLGGMSGGAVLDVNGQVVGITSMGLDTDDQQGPTLAAWWLPAFFWRPQLSWPHGFYDKDMTVSELPAVNVVGREHAKLTEDGQLNLTRWQ